MIFRYESDCSLSSTQRIVRLGFIHRLESASLQWLVGAVNGFFSVVKIKNDTDANGGGMRCKVASMQMAVFGY